MTTFAVVTPVKDTTYLRQTIRSVKDLRLPQGWKIIHQIVAPASILKEIKHIGFDMRNVVIEKSRGIFPAMNQGIEEVTKKGADWISILNADDLFATKRILEYLAKALRENPVTQIVYGNLNIFKGNPQNTIRKWVAGEYGRIKLLLGWMPPHPTVIAKSECYRKGLFNLDLPASADYELMVRWFLRENFVSKYVNELFVNMRAGGASSKIKTRIDAMKHDYLALTLNGVRGYNALFTVFAKRIRKIPQFVLARLQRLLSGSGLTSKQNS